jgi:hypothetical protein
MRAIIVDDMAVARERLKLLLSDAGIEIIAECDNGRFFFLKIQRKSG